MLGNMDITDSEEEEQPQTIALYARRKAEREERESEASDDDFEPITSGPDGLIPGWSESRLEKLEIFSLVSGSRDGWYSECEEEPGLEFDSHDEKRNNAERKYVVVRSPAGITLCP